MARTPLTREILDNFGPGDQFHLFIPETGERTVAEITRIQLKPRPEDNDQELRVEIQYAFEFLENGSVEPRSSLAWYDGPLLSDLFISRQEDGYLEIPNIPGEQVILLIKQSHPAFVKVLAGLFPGQT